MCWAVWCYCSKMVLHFQIISFHYCCVLLNHCWCIHPVPQNQATFNSSVKHWLILIFLHTTSRKKLDVNKCNFTHFTLILLLRYLVECGTHGLAIYNNEFIFGSACIGYFETWCIQMCFICYCNNCISKEQYFELLFLCQTVWHPVAFEKHVFSCIDLTCVQWCRQVGRGGESQPPISVYVKNQYWTLRKRTTFFSTRLLYCIGFDFDWGSAPDPTGKASEAPNSGFWNLMPLHACRIWVQWQIRVCVSEWSPLSPLIKSRGCILYTKMDKKVSASTGLHPWPSPADPHHWFCSWTLLDSVPSNPTLSLHSSCSTPPPPASWQIMDLPLLCFALYDVPSCSGGDFF